MAWDWEGELPALAAQTDTAAAAAISAMTKTQNVDSITTYQLYESIVRAEADVLSAADKVELDRILSLGLIYVRAGKTRNTLTAMFGAGTATRANLLATTTITVPKYSDPCSPGQVHSWRAQR
jgi:hypothetical protein